MTTASAVASITTATKNPCLCHLRRMRYSLYHEYGVQHIHFCTHQHSSAVLCKSNSSVAPWAPFYLYRYFMKQCSDRNYLHVMDILSHTYILAPISCPNDNSIRALLLVPLLHGAALQYHLFKLDENVITRSCFYQSMVVKLPVCMWFTFGRRAPRNPHYPDRILGLVHE